MSTHSDEQLLDDFLEHHALDAIYSDMTVEEYFEHFGVKGMKWGVRREDRSSSNYGTPKFGGRKGIRLSGDTRPSGIDKVSARYNRSFVGKGTTSITRVMSSGPFRAAQVAALGALVTTALAPAGPAGIASGISFTASLAVRTAQMHTLQALWSNKDNVSRINGSPKYNNKNLRSNPKLQEQYHKDQMTSLKKALMDPRGMRLAETKLRVNGNPGGKTITISGRDLHHADENTDVIVDVTYNKLGHIVDLVPRVPKELLDAFFDIVNEDVTHTLVDDEISDETLDFLVHWGVKGMKWGVRKRGKDDSDAADSTHPDAVNVAALRKKKISQLSNAEMKAVTERMNLEKKYREMNPTDQELLMRKLKKHADTATKVVMWMATPTGKALLKSMGLDDKSRKNAEKAKVAADLEKRKAKLKEKADKKAAKKAAEDAKPKPKKEYIGPGGGVIYR